MEVIQFEDLSKLYRLGQIGTGTLSHDLNRWWAGIRGKDDPFEKIGKINDQSKNAGKHEYVWALKDVNASIERGEVVGIVGKNGAGKSTLLKILSRITAPTKGAIKIRGRVASLLEVGTGFHPEMTGRENIFMNGTVMGMTRREINTKLDQIIDFSGVGKYIDTPVKRYSSGMGVRLGFAVAAHLDPDILVVDEVLAVGDAEFQKKAIGKMKEVSQAEGRTVLFVSHNMAAVKNLCGKAIWLKNGGIKDVGDCQQIVASYLKEDLVQSNESSSIDLGNHVDKFDREYGLLGAKIFVNDVSSNAITTGDSLKIVFQYRLPELDAKIPMELGLAILDSAGEPLVGFNNRHFNQVLNLNGTGTIAMEIPSFPFYTNEALYLNFYFGYIKQRYEILKAAAQLRPYTSDFLGHGRPLEPGMNKYKIEDVRIYACEESC